MVERTGRVLVVTQDLGGGTGRHLVALVRRWRDAGWTVEVICQGDIDDSMARGINVYPGPSSTWFHHFPIAQYRCLRQVEQCIAAFEPDIVHSFFFWSIMYGRILKRRGTIRCLVENREDQGFNWAPPNYAMLRRTAEYADLVICVARAVADVATAREHLSPHQVRVLHNGIDIELRGSGRSAARQSLGFSPTDLVVGMVANLNRAVKGVEFFLDAVPVISKAVPRAQFVIVGDGPLRRRFEQHAQSLGVSDRVQFAGYQASVETYYSAFDISVLTSLSEGLSMTLLESMRHALPVVVTDVGGNRELVVDGQTGILVPPRDPHAFGRRVIELLGDEPARVRMGREAARRVRDRFNVDVVAGKYLNAYSDLLTSRDCGTSGASAPRAK